MTRNNGLIYWDAPGVLTEMAEDREEIYQRAGMKDQFGYGQSPAIVAVDFQKGMTVPENPLGSELDEMVEQNERLVETAHEHDVPVVWSVWCTHIRTLPTAASGPKRSSR